MKNPLFVLSVLAAVTVSSAALRSAETVATAPAYIDGLTELDEIVVSGELESLSGARKAIIEAEDRFYARYNELNKNDAFDINCRIEIPTGQRLGFRVCQPRYVDDGLHQEAQRLYLPTDEGTVQLQTADVIYSARVDEMKKHTLALVKQDPELLRALLERARLEQFYTELRKKKLKGRWIAWD